MTPTTDDRTTDLPMTGNPTADLPMTGHPTAEAHRVAGSGPGTCEMSRHGIFLECPQCGGDMAPEHAHYRCAGCGWRDSCCD